MSVFKISYQKYLVILAVIFSFYSCKTAGLYTSNPKERMAFAGTEFELMKNDSFSIRSWTDSYTIHVDEKGNRIFENDIMFRGYGTYECLDDSLQLTFVNEDSIRIELDLKRSDQMVEINLQTFSETNNVLYPQVDILDANGIRLDGTYIQVKDSFNYNIPIINKPTHIRLSGFEINIKDPIIDITKLSDGWHTVKKKSYNGYFSRGKKKIWFKF